MGEVTLPIYVGPTMFNIIFQVMDISPAYSCLLGRPWIHMAGAVPSSLHQRVKFITNHQLINVVGEKELVISTLAPEEYIEGNEEALETSFQSLEFTDLENPSLSPTVEKMAFRVMIKEGYQPGKGLGPHLNGISTLNKGKVGLGYYGGNNQGKDLDSSPIAFNLDQHFTRGEVAMIRDEPMSHQRGVCITKEELANWMAKELPDKDLFMITNNEPPSRSNATLILKDLDPANEPVKDEDAELESVNLGNETEKKEVKVGKQMPQDLRFELSQFNFVTSSLQSTEFESDKSLPRPYWLSLCQEQLGHVGTTKHSLINNVKRLEKKSKSLDGSPAIGMKLRRGYTQSSKDVDFKGLKWQSHP
ncbi:hypothetical protein CR513_61760, partial [Mucuna pruriens]